MNCTKDGGNVIEKWKNCAKWKVGMSERFASSTLELSHNQQQCNMDSAGRISVS